MIDQIAVRSALATDTGGSTRLPASYCGILGFKPSYGLLSRFGVVAYASSLDTVGLMSKEVDHIRQVFGESHLQSLDVLFFLTKFSRAHLRRYPRSPRSSRSDIYPNIRSRTSYFDVFRAVESIRRKFEFERQAIRRNQNWCTRCKFCSPCFEIVATEA
jgi:hypothetical protein